MIQVSNRTCVRRNSFMTKRSVIKKYIILIGRLLQVVTVSIHTLLITLDLFRRSLNCREWMC